MPGSHQAGGARPGLRDRPLVGRRRPSATTNLNSAQISHFLVAQGTHETKQARARADQRNLRNIRDVVRSLVPPAIPPALSVLRTFSCP